MRDSKGRFMRWGAGADGRGQRWNLTTAPGMVGHIDPNLQAMIGHAKLVVPEPKPIEPPKPRRDWQFQTLPFDSKTGSDGFTVRKPHKILDRDTFVSIFNIRRSGVFACCGCYQLTGFTVAAPDPFPEHIWEDIIKWLKNGSQQLVFLPTSSQMRYPMVKEFIKRTNSKEVTVFENKVHGPNYLHLHHMSVGSIK